MTLKTNADAHDKAYFFDKNTGEKFVKLSGVLLNNINHYHMKSAVSGKTVLLSEYGIQRRFSSTSNHGLQRLRDLVPRFFDLK